MNDGLNFVACKTLAVRFYDQRRTGAKDSASELGKRGGRQRLFHGYGFCEVAWLIHVAATADGNVICEQL
jgi:hypothetical protein